VSVNPYEPPMEVPAETSYDPHLFRAPATWLIVGGIALVFYSCVGVLIHGGDARALLRGDEQQRALANINTTFGLTGAGGLTQILGGMLLLWRRARWLVILACVSALLVWLPTIVISGPAALCILWRLRKSEMW
jgi:hypothetical protein